MNKTEANHVSNREIGKENDSNDETGEFVYIESENAKGSEKVIVRVKQSARNRANFSKKSGKSALSRKTSTYEHYVMRRKELINNRTSIGMKVGHLDTQSNCNFRDMVRITDIQEPE